ncbi:hypothetical protein BOTBODRAFT_191359 [Botryobasidium botryosum FD-172 SS1]|uniref:SAM domain-containing protein n=1 Tax=Botryobasidium botryosum (strain FD-172 SS1) TaxID=930990 RepID=A0A067M2T5_BOTB1|nr:hypothetical protein BOTBODRAFT_191359 [Botryobasidium botryosum FD-172 SS1]
MSGGRLPYLDVPAAPIRRPFRRRHPPGPGEANAQPRPTGDPAPSSTCNPVKETDELVYRLGTISDWLDEMGWGKHSVDLDSGPWEHFLSRDEVSLGGRGVDSPATRRGMLRCFPYLRYKAGFDSSDDPKIDVNAITIAYGRQLMEVRRDESTWPDIIPPIITTSRQAQQRTIGRRSELRDAVHVIATFQPRLLLDFDPSASLPFARLPSLYDD